MMIKTTIIPAAKICIGDFISDDWQFCGLGLREVFDVPDGATEIQFYAYKEPKAGRTKVTFDYGLCYVTVSGEDEPYCLDWTTSRSLKSLIGKRRKIWYVDLYYWEN